MSLVVPGHFTLAIVQEAFHNAKCQGGLPIENQYISEMWKIWYASWFQSKDETEIKISLDILDLIRSLVEEKVVVACLKDPLLDPDRAFEEILAEIGIREKEFHKVIRT